MFNAPYFFWDHEPQRRPARVRIRRDMICRPLCEAPRHVAIGEELVISDATFCELSRGDIEFLGRVADELSFEI